MSGFWQMVVFDAAGVAAMALVVLLAPDGPRLRRRKSRR